MTPRIDGSAIGFLVMDCIKAPAVPKAQPAISPSTVRTILFCRIGKYSELISSPRAAPIRSDSGIFLAPTANERGSATSKSSTLTAIKKTVFFAFIIYSRWDAASSSTSRYSSMVAGIANGVGVQDAAIRVVSFDRNATEPLLIAGT